MARIAWYRCRMLLRIGTQIAGLWLLSLLAQALAARSPLPVPAGALGLLLLFALLATGALRSEWIAEGADLLVRHLALFLVPFAVGFMAFADLFAAAGSAIGLAVVVSTACGIAAAGFTAQATAREPQRSKRLQRSEP